MAGAHAGAAGSEEQLELCAEDDLRLSVSGLGAPAGGLGAPVVADGVDTEADVGGPLDVMSVEVVVGADGHGMQIGEVGLVELPPAVLPAEEGLGLGRDVEAFSEKALPAPVAGLEALDDGLCL